ncbi:hypothetical protein [Xanthomonas campestris]|uniref:hypothetical protein n=1 Tax=Xanthomonas campestris TaxID=339 RepID=UPI001E56C38A|nr:hypothetical protein [Xanthomonas campestris]MCC8685769.1 hypothetical protein [Xanthomonas campestris]MCW1997859.1 hypothetical protein [Xanthomonas campestris]MEA9677412.1 hypothetical protein [Xanthomonas campestris pv. raphani]MEA9698267.1 hypothetical protein [Xanthomonas campestris pv. raphani]MEA9778536.1 hypothetical protein [Xanthomonas campestris pv. raphani]
MHPPEFALIFTLGRMRGWISLRSVDRYAYLSPDSLSAIGLFDSAGLVIGRAAPDAVFAAHRDNAAPVPYLRQFQTEAGALAPVERQAYIALDHGRLDYAALQLLRTRTAQRPSHT